MPHVQTAKISDAAKEVLSRSTIGTDRVTLPVGKLDNNIYREIDKAFKILGGKWNKTQKSHLFPSNPKAAIAKLIKTGEVLDKQKTNQAYYTPPDLAELVAAELGITKGSSVLEPSAGHGALAEAAREYGGIVTCCEIDEDSCDVLVEKGFDVVTGDFLAISAGWCSVKKQFDFIIMNPPFNRQQDISHAIRATHLLRRGGKMACVMTRAYQTSKMKIAAELRTLLESESIYHRTVDLPVFEGSGSGVAPVCLIITKS